MLARDLRSLTTPITQGVTVDLDRTRKRPGPLTTTRMILVGVLIVVGLAVFPSVRSAVFGSDKALRVAILPARVQSEDSLEVALASAAAQSALLTGLAGLREVSAVDPAELGTDAKNAVDAARVTAADEVMSVSLSPMGREWNVSLRRLEGRSGSVKWNESFAVPRDDPWTLDAAIRTHLPRGFPRHRRSDASSPQIDREGYEEYLRLLRTYAGRGGGTISRDQLLPRLERLASRSPRFADAHLLLGREYLSQFIVDRRPELLTSAFAAAERAHTMAPWDARPLMLLADCSFRSQDLSQVERWIAALRELEPGNTEIMIREGKLAERRGDADRAHRLMLLAFQRRGSQANLRALADLEVRIGRIAEARSHLHELLTRFPTESWPRSKLANLELAYGRPEAAESLYTELIHESPRMPHLTNRGIARMLMGRFVPAAEDFRAALEMSPGTWSTLLNLADCELLDGQDAAAKVHYREVIDRVSVAGSTAGWQEHLARAQALAHLGSSESAIAAAQEGLRATTENAEALYQAAVVYALVGDRAATIRYGRRAIEKGFELRWFALPWFNDVRSELEKAKKPLASSAHP